VFVGFMLANCTAGSVGLSIRAAEPATHPAEVTLAPAEAANAPGSPVKTGDGDEIEEDRPQVLKEKEVDPIDRLPDWILPDAYWICTKEDGYRGIWYFNQPQKDEYVYKYSGGLGTYCDFHRPLAIYVPTVNKTFFCYGGTLKGKNELVHMVSYFDHQTGMVPRPTAVLNKQTDDAHDNPVLVIDGRGHIWIFSSAHGTARKAYISVSTRPFDIDEFELVWITNFSYPQIYWSNEAGFLFAHTRYVGGHRCLFWMTSADGLVWSKPQLLAHIHQGHYHVSATHGNKLGIAFNYHPHPLGLNWRTNVYYMETSDYGCTWQTVDGKPLDLPLTTVENPALVHDYAAEDLRVYLRDMEFDSAGRPVILYTLSRGWESGPKNDPRIWSTAYWNGENWEIAGSIRSDNNYDMGSIYIEPDGTWRIVAPTEPGPQLYNTGGEVAIWESTDRGRSWTMIRQLTKGSIYNHSYCRKPINAHPDFYALWADGHGRQPSESRLYFCDKAGNVYRLPPVMEGDFARPEKLEFPAEQLPGEGPAATKPPVVAASEAAPTMPCSDSREQSRDLQDTQDSEQKGTQLKIEQPMVETSETNSPGNGSNTLRSSARPEEALPQVYLEKVNLVPDLCQTAPLFSDLPLQGRTMCGPTSIANVLFALEAQGLRNLVPGKGTAEERAKLLLQELTGRYLPLNSRGISPTLAMEGLERYFQAQGYRVHIAWRGWRYGGRFAEPEPLEETWLCQGVLELSHVVLNVGWYQFDAATERYQRFGGHYMTLIGYRRQNGQTILLVHDPAARSGPNKVTHEAVLTRLESGRLAPWARFSDSPAAGVYRIDGIVIHPAAHCALIDGAMRIEPLLE